MSDDDTPTAQLPAGFEIRPSAKEYRERQIRANDEAVQQALTTYKAQQQPGRHRIENVELWAWCPDVVGCDDTQVRVIGTKLVHNRTFGEQDPSTEPVYRNVISDTFTDFEFADPGERLCPRCGTDRAISDQKRVPYPPLSGKDPTELLRIAKWWKENGGRPSTEPGAIIQAAKPVEDDEVAELRKQIADLKAIVEGGNGQQLPKGVRQRGDRYEALLFRSESETGKQQSVGRFDTAAEAAAAREAALS